MALMNFSFVAIRNSKINRPLPLRRRTPSLSSFLCLLLRVLFFSLMPHHRRSPKKLYVDKHHRIQSSKSSKSTNQKKKAVEKFLLDFFQKNFFVCVEIDRSVRIERRRKKTQRSEYKNLRFLIHLYHVCSNK